MRFADVYWVAAKVAIVGTGASLKDKKLKFPEAVTVIAVNGAIDYLDRADFWFTLDPSPVNMERMNNPKPGVRYCAAVPDDWPELPQHVYRLTRVHGDGWGRFKTKGGLPADTNRINTGNSGWGAFQLACHMRPYRIALFGLDGDGPYHYGGTPKVLGMMPELFASAVPEIKRRGVGVVNASPISTVKCFPTVTVKEGVTWISN